MKMTAAPSKALRKPVEQMDYLDLETKNILNTLHAKNRYRPKTHSHIVFRYLVDYVNRDDGKGESVMDRDLMFFGLEDCNPCAVGDKKAYYYEAAQEIVNHLSKGECVYPNAGCEVCTYTEGKSGHLKVIATLLNGWKNWKFEVRNDCSYSELKWTIEELDYLGMLPHGKA